MRLLRRRGIVCDVDPSRYETLFNRAWAAARRAGSPLADRPRYWQDEIEHVIKGRGLARLEDYLPLERIGRITRLSADQRRAVWQLFLDYQRLLRDERQHDFADVLLLALDAVTHDPEPGIDTIIIDEAQDLSLVAVRLAHAIVGDQPNGLLLLGDAQQSVYPGGYRLVEAGVDVRGRAVRLNTNYRNGSNVLNEALRMLEFVSSYDLDGTPLSVPTDVVMTRAGGEVVHVTAASAEDRDRAFVAAVRSFVDPSGSVVLGGSRNVVDNSMRLLASAGIAVQDLDAYDGRPTDAVKVGTFQRVKGLDFKAAFIPRFGEELRLVRDAGDPDRAKDMAYRLYVGMTRPRDLLWLGSVAEPHDSLATADEWMGARGWLMPS
jgi:superfamily I DNA/RNA helicase